MRILLVDDNPKHRRAGVRQLTVLGHEVVALCDYGEARQRAEEEDFDAALLDLLMPAEPTTLGTEACKEHLGREIAIGFPMALELSRHGIIRIAVATDTNHHNHPMSAVVDWFSSEALFVNGAKVMILHAPLYKDHMDWVKDWGKILAILIGIE